MHYRGSADFQTKLGSLVTIATYTLILINALSILGDYVTNDNQTEIYRRLKVNLREQSERNLADNLVSLSWLGFGNPRVGRFKVSKVFSEFQDPTDD